MDTNANSKRIARNTMMLYIRMLLVMGISLYTVRVVLNFLGEVDYGIYNVVGGIVLMFSFLNSSLASASQRFFSFELGKNGALNLKQLFSSMLFFYIIVCLVLFLIVEVVGIWFLNNKLNIPDDRITAANYVFHFSVLTFILRMINTPFQAFIIAQEQMSVYAIIGIIEVVLQLVLVFCLNIFGGDSLIIYSILVAVNIFIVTTSYIIYCKVKYSDCTLIPSYDKDLAKDISKYSGWMMLYGFSEVFYVQGINMLLNMFFDVVVNSARAIAYQVYGAIKLFGVNFFKAVEPQLTKQYAHKNTEEAFSLMIASSKLSFYLILLLSMPIICYAPYVLKIWLIVVPDHAVVFSQLMLIDAIIGILGNPLGTLSRATGVIGKYSVVISVLYMSNMPLAYICLKMGAPATSVFVVMIILCIVTLVARLVLLKEQIPSFSTNGYFKHVIKPITIISLFSVGLYFGFIQIEVTNFLQFLGCSLMIIMCVLFLCYVIGISKAERNLVNSIIKRYMKK